MNAVGAECSRLQSQQSAKSDRFDKLTDSTNLTNLPKRPRFVNLGLENGKHWLSEARKKLFSISPS